VAELPPRTEKIAPTIAPTIALNTKLTPSATNQPIMTLVQLVLNSALSLTYLFSGDCINPSPEISGLGARQPSYPLSFGTNGSKGLRALPEMHHGSPSGILYSEGKAEPSRKPAGKEGTLTAEVLDKFAELITVALGLVAALAWNEAIQQLFTELLGEAGGALAAKFVYAVIVTLVVIFATISVSRAAERARLTEERRRLEERTP
jgi:hypothetical protein